VEVRIVTFPETAVAAITHLGPPEAEHDTVRKLVAWKLENGLTDSARYRSYSLHYHDPDAVDPDRYRVDFFLSIDESVAELPEGIVRTIIPELMCACARDIGSRLNNRTARYLSAPWLPQSTEELSGDPIIFHYVNVGPKLRAEEAITDVYMPLKGSAAGSGD